MKYILRKYFVFVQEFASFQTTIKYKFLVKFCVSHFSHPIKMKYFVKYISNSNESLFNYNDAILSKISI